MLLLVTAATDYERFAKVSRRDVAAATAKDLKSAARKEYAKLITAHEADYQGLFNRVKLELPESGSEISRRPTPERIAAQDLAQDPSLAQLYFNFGRYLLISSSRPGGMPANLQGLWTDTVSPPWSADYHLNINLQMIYWPADVCNLGGLNEPLFSYIESLQAPGAKTAQAYYNAHGWVSMCWPMRGVLLRPAKAPRGVRRPATAHGCAIIYGSTGNLPATKNICAKSIPSCAVRRNFSPTC